MMVSLLIGFFLILFNINMFIGSFLYLMTYITFLSGFYLFGISFMKSNLFGGLGMDYLSYFMILLLIWIISIVLILFFDFLLVVLLLGLIISMFFMFVSMDLLYLFIFFEFSMLPMFLMIMFFGGSKERYGAGLYMFIYTMVSSMPALVVMMFIMSWGGGVGMDYMMFGYVSLGVFIEFFVIFMFLVKVPMFMFHIWLPKAHVEAPAFGSMILASVMLKMGGYGVVRFKDFMILDVFTSDFFFCFCLIGAAIISYICMFQVDLKVLVAYSSIIHMSIMLMGFFSESDLGNMGGVIMMLSHGICSSGMFYLVNEIYNLSGSRILMLSKGMMSGSPILMGFWLIMLINNLGAPPCFGVLGELMLLGGCLMYSGFVFFFFFFYYVFCVLFCD